MTEAEQAQAAQKLTKIRAVNEKMLKMRKDQVYTEAALGQTEKFAMLSPDFTTVWNYRREILLHLFKTEGNNSAEEGSPEKIYGSLEGKLGVIKKELIMLVKHVMASPKSYSIWEHRVWTISQGLKLERQYLQAIKRKKQAEKEAAAVAQEEAKDGDDEAAELINMPGEEAKEVDDALWKSAILDNELKLCSKMLGMDERNFHCWNYRH